MNTRFTLTLGAALVASGCNRSQQEQPRTVDDTRYTVPSNVGNLEWLRDAAFTVKVSDPDGDGVPTEVEEYRKSDPNDATSYPEKESLSVLFPGFKPRSYPSSKCTVTINDDDIVMSNCDGMFLFLKGEIPYPANVQLSIITATYLGSELFDEPIAPEALNERLPNLAPKDFEGGAILWKGMHSTGGYFYHIALIERATQRDDGEIILTVVHQLGVGAPFGESVITARGIGALIAVPGYPSPTVYLPKDSSVGSDRKTERK